LVSPPPAAAADLAYQNKAVIYDLLFKVSAETMLTIAADPKRLGARIGITSVLHTWGSALTHHPHVHMIVPGGGISLDGERWVACRQSLLPAGARTLTPIPATIPGEARRRPPSRTPQLLRRPHTSGRCAILRGLSRPGAQGRLGRLRKAPIRRTRGRAGLSVALYPPRRHRQQPLDRLRYARRQLPMA